MSKCSGIHSKKLKQTTLRTAPVIPNMANDDLDRFHEQFAKWVYESGTPFSRIESKTLKAALSVLRPNITLPTRANMSNSLLNQTFETVAGSINEALKKSGELSLIVCIHSYDLIRCILDGICLTTDGWSNVLGEPVVNYCAVTPIQTFFLEVISTETDGHTAEFIAGDIKRVIESNHSLKDRIVGCCTDNTAANQSAWAKLKEVYPDKYFYGCVCSCALILGFREEFLYLFIRPQ